MTTEQIMDRMNEIDKHLTEATFKFSSLMCDLRKQAEMEENGVPVEVQNRTVSMYDLIKRSFT